jgi:hypothetical protein
MTSAEYKYIRHMTGTADAVAVALGVDIRTIQRRETGDIAINKEAEIALTYLYANGGVGYNDFSLVDDYPIEIINIPTNQWQRKNHRNVTVRLLETRWWGIINRCYRSTCPSYKHYGGRGIKLCDEWYHSYEAFERWSLANGYKEGYHLHRIDNDGGYHPDNCRYLPPSKHSRIKRIRIKQ